VHTVHNVQMHLSDVVARLLIRAWDALKQSLTQRTEVLQYVGNLWLQSYVYTHLPHQV
jgi:hypothetical protein